MPTRLDDATVRVRLLVDDETRRKAKPGGSTAARKRELADRRPKRAVATAKTQSQKGSSLDREAKKLADEKRQKTIRDARLIRGVATRPLGVLREAGQAAVGGGTLAKKVGAGILTVAAFTKLIEDALPIITTAVVTALEEATGFSFNSGQEFIDSISDSLTEVIAEVRGFVVAGGRTFNEAEARTRLAQAAGVTLDPAQLRQGLADTFTDVQEIEKEKRFLERTVSKQKNRNLVRQVIKSVLGD